MAQRRLRVAGMLIDIALTTAVLLRLALPYAVAQRPLADLHRAPPTSRLTPAQIARWIGAAYGDPRARVVQARPDESEGPPFHPMYSMELCGHFHKGTRYATSLGFAALADQLYAWAIEAHNGRALVWTDEQWPKTGMPS